jgi:L-Ala-D/L-Glu epimerase / N-acetyl-D-glutamate racemase
MSGSPEVSRAVSQTIKLHDLTLRRVRLPLIQPYVLSYRTFTEFEPIIVEVRDGDGRVGWGEGHISPGSSNETREGGWTFCREHASAIIGKTTVEAKAVVAQHASDNKVAATALLTAIEMLEDHPLLRIDREVRLPLLTPFNSAAPKEIEAEVERRAQGRLSNLQD